MPHSATLASAPFHICADDFLRIYLLPLFRRILKKCFIASFTDLMIIVRATFQQLAVILIDSNTRSPCLANRHFIARP